MTMNEAIEAKAEQPTSNQRGMMKVPVFVGPGEIEVREVPIPKPDADQVLVRVESCALCTWEQRMWTGEAPSYPMAGGHEMSGVVIEKGDQVFVDVEPGDKVTVAGLNRCLQCESCRRGNNNVCENANKMRSEAAIPGPGGLGQYVVTQGADVFSIAEHVPFDQAALSEPVACVLRSVKRAQLMAGERVVIVGAGLMGLLHLQLAKRAGTFVIVSEPDEERRAKALEEGADVAFDPLEDDYIETVRGLSTSGRGADVTFICVAHASTVLQGVQASANNGRVLCYSSFHPRGQTIEVDPNIFHSKEVTLTGTMSQTREDFFEAAELISNGGIDLAPLVSATYPGSELERAFEAALTKDTYRVVVHPQSNS